MEVQSIQVEFIAFDPEGVLTKETWNATKLFCPRCGQGSGAVWVKISDQPIQVGNVQTRVFLCVGCEFVAFGLNGFQPAWDVAERGKQIFQHGFQAKPPADQSKLIVG